MALAKLSAVAARAAPRTVILPVRAPLLFTAAAAAVPFFETGPAGAGCEERVEFPSVSAGAVNGPPGREESSDLGETFGRDAASDPGETSDRDETSDWDSPSGKGASSNLDEISGPGERSDRDGASDSDETSERDMASDSGKTSDRDVTSDWDNPSVTPVDSPETIREPAFAFFRRRPRILTGWYRKWAASRQVRAHRPPDTSPAAFSAENPVTFIKACTRMCHTGSGCSLSMRTGSLQSRSLAIPTWIP